MTSPSGRIFESHHGSHLFVIDGSRIYDLDDGLLRSLRLAEAESEGAFDVLVASLFGTATPYIDDSVLLDPPVRSLSLAVALKCNIVYDGITTPCVSTSAS